MAGTLICLHFKTMLIHMLMPMNGWHRSCAVSLYVGEQVTHGMVCMYYSCFYTDFMNKLCSIHRSKLNVTRNGRNVILNAESSSAKLLMTRISNAGKVSNSSSILLAYRIARFFCESKFVAKLR